MADERRTKRHHRGENIVLECFRAQRRQVLIGRQGVTLTLRHGPCMLRTTQQRNPSQESFESKPGYSTPETPLEDRVVCPNRVRWRWSECVDRPRHLLDTFLSSARSSSSSAAMTLSPPDGVVAVFPCTSPSPSFPPPATLPWLKGYVI